MLRYKHLRLDQEKIDKAKRILKAKTETEALDRALDKIIHDEQMKLRRSRVVKRMIDLRNELGRLEEDSADWVRIAREERASAYDSSP